MRQQRGFTLIELMIVVGVIAILAAIAIPNYLEQSKKGRRSEAMRSVGELQLALERWRAENPCYGESGAGGCPTFTASGTYTTIPGSAESPYYTLTINPATESTYTITASPRPGSKQAGDSCGNLVANNTDKQKPRWDTASCNN